MIQHHEKGPRTKMDPFISAVGFVNELSLDEKPQIMQLDIVSHYENHPTQHGLSHCMEGCCTTQSMQTIR